MRYFKFILPLLVVFAVLAFFYSQRTTLSPEKETLTTENLEAAKSGNPAAPAARALTETTPSPTPAPSLAAEKDASPRLERSEQLKRATYSRRLEGLLPQGWKFVENFRVEKKRTNSQDPSIAGHRLIVLENGSSAPADALWVAANPDRQQLGIVTGYVFTKLEDSADPEAIASSLGLELAQENTSSHRAVFKIPLDASAASKIQALKSDDRLQSVRMEVQSIRVERQ